MVTADREGAMKDESAIRITVTFERRDDGGLYVYSDDLPGFVLSHLDAHAVVADIEPALAVFLSQKFSCAVSVRPLTELREALISDGMIDRVPNGRVTKRDYVGIAA